MAHLHAILATESPLAVLVKRGPGRCSGLFGWDRRSDTFENGQWLKQRLDHGAADLSPDGTLFVYYINTQRYGREHSVYRAVSRPPWLKALTFWSGKNWLDGPGPGLFFRDRDKTLKLHASAHAPQWNHAGIQTVTELPHFPPWTALAQVPFIHRRLQRYGWTTAFPVEYPTPGQIMSDADWERIARQTPAFDRSLPGGWTLRQIRCGPRKKLRQGISNESFSLLPPGGEPIPMPDWEWADHDAPRNRLVWTADCTLFAAPWTRRGLGAPRVLLDTNGFGFETKQAPY